MFPFASGLPLVTCARCRQDTCSRCIWGSLGPSSECAVMGRRILKAQQGKHIDRWQVDFDPSKHQEHDSVRRWLPKIVLTYLQANYPDEIVKEILHRLDVMERGRQIVLCRSCEPFVKKGKLQVAINDSDPFQTRLCDYAVDPVVALSAERMWERWQDHNGSFEESDLADAPSECYVLGRSLHQFAEPIAALNDGEEMVNTMHGIACLLARYCFSLTCLDGE